LIDTVIEQYNITAYSPDGATTSTTTDCYPPGLENGFKKPLKPQKSKI